MCIVNTTISLRKYIVKFLYHQSFKSINSFTFLECTLLFFSKKCEENSDKENGFSKVKLN